MATYTHNATAVPSGIPWYNVIIDGDNPVGTPNATLLILPNSDGTETRIMGTGFTYDDQGETGGTVTQIQRTSSGGGTVYETITGLNLSLVTLTEFEHLLGNGEMFAFIFGSADAFNGFAGDDFFIGGPGGDAFNGGSGGTDTVSYDNALGAVRADLGAPGTNTSDAASDTYTSIENLDGSNFNDTLVGNGQANTINGAGGNDTMIGGDGDDTYIVHSSLDVITEAASGSSGLDTAVVFASYQMPANVEVIYGLNAASGLTLSGGGGNDVIYGSNFNDTLSGVGGNDTLLGFGGTNAFSGGDGDDVFYSQSASDTFTEASGAGSGLDLVVTYHDITLAANIENVVLLAAATSATGNAGDNLISGFPAPNALTLNGGDGSDTIYGSAQQDTINGGIGNDLLLGFGGANLMQGGSGDDVYYSFSATDTITETSGVGSGFDTVVANVDINLSANIEQLILLTGATTANGSASNDIIYGPNANNGLTINGLGGHDVIYGTGFSDALTGGDGDDIMLGFGGTNSFVGGAGHDQYYTDSNADTFTGAEGTLGGTDLVVASYDFTLGANFESLILTGAATSGTGNGENNTLNASPLGHGATLDGAGGNDNFFGSTFADTMTGGLGDDVMFGDAGSDTFQFTPVGNFGDDIVTDFVATAANAVTHDLIDMRGHGFADFAALNSNISYSGAGATITIGADSIFLSGVTSGLQTSDFIFL